MLTTAPDLTHLIDRLCRTRGVGVDTEFVWERTYFPQLGIVQLASSEGDEALVDACAAFDPGPLAGLLESPAVEKILHDARQDLVILGRYCGAARPRRLFDTRLAAGFAGHPPTLSLQQLLREVLGIELPKSETRTNWLRRPLSASQLEYALDDVRHLPALRDALREAARERGTADWLEEEMRSLEDVALYEERDPDMLWSRIRGAGSLDGRGRAILRELARLREERAAAKDLPRTWWLADAVLLDLAAQPPDGRDELRRRVGGAARGERIEALFDAVRRGCATPPADRPPALRRARPDPELKQRTDQALAALRTIAATLRIDPALFGSRAQVGAFLEQPADPRQPLAGGWRLAVAGRELAERFALPGPPAQQQLAL